MLELFRKRLGRIPDEVGSCAGTLVTFKYLLDNGLDPNSRDQHGRTMLAQHAQGIDDSIDTHCEAARLEEVYIVQLLLQHGADPNRTDADGNSALLQAQIMNRPRIQELPKTGRIRGTNKDGTPQDCPPPMPPPVQ